MRDSVTHADIADALQWHMRVYELGTAFNAPTDALAELMGHMTYQRHESVLWMSLTDAQQQAISEAMQRDGRQQTAISFLETRG